MPYKVSQQTGFIDYDKLEEKALDFKPKLIICGGSAYPRDSDYARFRAIADKCGAMLLCDMASISRLVAAQVPLLFSLTFFGTVTFIYCIFFYYIHRCMQDSYVHHGLSFRVYW